MRAVPEPDERAAGAAREERVPVDVIFCGHGDSHATIVGPAMGSGVPGSTSNRRGVPLADGAL